MNAERQLRREMIATQIMGALTGVGKYACWEDQAHDAVAMASALISKLDEAALADTPDADPVHQTAAMQDLQAAKEAAANRSVAKSILIWQKDRQIADLQDQLAALKQQAAGCEKLDALMQFVESVRAEAEDDDELYGPFVALVRDLDAKVGAK